MLRELDIEQMFLENADGLYTFIFYQVGNDSELAADIVQETFVKAMADIARYDPQRGTTLAWLVTLSRNLIRKARRANSGHIVLSQISEGMDSDLAGQLNRIETELIPDEIVQRKECKELVHLTLGSLPKKYSFVLRQYYFHQKSLKDISQLLQSSEGAIKTQLCRARQSFKDTFVKLADSFAEHLVERGTK